jgi:phospholipase C
MRAAPVLAACAAMAAFLANSPVRAATSAAFVAPPFLRILPQGHVAMRQQKIQHVVLIIQENHSFDNLFQGYPGANTQSYGYDSKGDMITLAPEPLGYSLQLAHVYQDFVWNYDGGKMDGFDLNGLPGGQKLLAYTYVDQTDIGPYLQMAGQYVLADDYFSSHLDASFVAHQYLLAAQADHAVDLPTSTWGCTGGPSDMVATISGTAENRKIGPGIPPCFGSPSSPAGYETLGDLLDEKGLTWRWYSPKKNATGYLWMGYQAVPHIIDGPDAVNIIHPETQVLTDIANGQLANMTWVTPAAYNSDHPGSNSKTGPSWVASVINAVGMSPFWNSTAIFVTWDEWGGEFDHVPPPQVYYDGLGMRVPLLCISPYALDGVVNHTQLESSSIVRFVEDNFALGRLEDAKGKPVRDSRAKPASKGCLDLHQAPRAFTPITSEYSRGYFVHQRPLPPPQRDLDDLGD